MTFNRITLRHNINSDNIVSFASESADWKQLVEKRRIPEQEQEQKTLPPYEASAMLHSYPCA
jgi:hypothetical protein